MASLCQQCNHGGIPPAILSRLRYPLEGRLEPCKACAMLYITWLVCEEHSADSGCDRYYYYFFLLPLYFPSCLFYNTMHEALLHEVLLFIHPKMYFMFEESRVAFAAWHSQTEPEHLMQLKAPLENFKWTLSCFLFQVEISAWALMHIQLCYTKSRNTKGSLTSESIQHSSFLCSRCPSACNLGPTGRLTVKQLRAQEAAQCLLRRGHFRRRSAQISHRTALAQLLSSFLQPGAMAMRDPGVSLRPENPLVPGRTSTALFSPVQ